MSIENEIESQPLFLPAEDVEDVKMEENVPQTISLPGSESTSRNNDHDWMSLDATDEISSTAAPNSSTQNGSTSSMKNEPSPSSSKVASSSSLSSASAAKQQNGKKRKTSPTSKPEKREFYLGTFLVGNAWSTSKGSGYVKPGDTICVERESPDEARPSKSDAKGKGKGKQATLFSMLKPQVKGGAAKKVKANTIVRLTNERGFEFGRLPQDISSWVSKLLDHDIVTFKGSTMVECEVPLRTGSDLVVSLSVYIRPSAFERYEASSSESSTPKFWSNEGTETEHEERLRERKTALRQLFERLDIKPSPGSNADFDEASYTSSKKENAARPTKATPLVNDVDADENEEEILSENELDVIYKRAQANDAAMDEMEPSSEFALTLRPYQKQALHWMYSRETGAASARASHSLHPLWAEYMFPPNPSNGLIDLTVDEIPFYYNTHSGELSLDFPRAENLCKGGILADVGMGKTIMVSSLIQTNRNYTEEELAGPSADQRQNKKKQLKLDAAFRPIKSKQTSRRSRATLIVAPASLLDQWCSELQRSSKKGSLNAFVWHGQNRDDLETMVDTNDVSDVVITSYGTLAAEHARLEKSSKNVPIFDIEWFRVVLDEAHNCKSRTSKTAKAVFDLKAGRRWALTGTPIVNRLEDLYSLLKFLDFTPWSEHSFFRSIVTLPFLNHEPKAIEVVQVILESVLLRREKSMRDKDGKKIVDLPSKEVVVEELQFTSLERSIYDSLYRVAKTKFDSLTASGMVGKRYTHILAMLMRLRRAVLHPSLVLEKNENEQRSTENIDVNELIKQFDANTENGQHGQNESYAQNVIEGLQEDEECPICFYVMEEPMIIPECFHKSCKDCILTYLLKLSEKGEEGHCPTCRQGPVVEDQLLEVVRDRQRLRQTSVGIEPERQPNEEGQSNGVGFTIRKNDFKSSTKLNALVQNLRRLQDQDPCFRAVVFSQFTSFLDLIEIALQRENLEWYRLDGSTEIKKRHQAIAEFNKPSRKPKIFMLSLKAGGVGLNLTAANHVFMMDCWWNSAIEQQAIDRVHRIGQEKTVFVKHFIIAETIEGRILQIQKRKAAIVKEAFKGQGSTDSESLENLKIMFEE